MVRIGERLNLSTFGAIGNRYRGLVTFIILFEWLAILIVGNLGGNTDSFVP